jgi:hypothetical protein
MTQDCEDFRPQFDWAYFFVWHFKPGVVFIEDRYFPCSGSIFGDDHIGVVLPMENTAILYLAIHKDRCDVRLHRHTGHDSTYPLKFEGGRLVRAGTDDGWGESIATTGDVAAYLRQLGRMEIV